MHRRPPLVIALSLAALVASCRQSPPAAAPPAAPPQPQAAVPDATDGQPAPPAPKAIARPGPVEVRPIEAGAEPLEVLRYRCREGLERSLLLVTTMVQRHQFGELNVNEGFPPMHLTLDTAVRQLGGEGDIRYQYEYTRTGVGEDPTVPETFSAMVRGMLPASVGSRGTGLLTAQGVVREAGLRVAPDAGPVLAEHLDRLDQAIGQMIPAFPAEPVGIGARWEVRRDVKEAGALLRQTVTYRLVARSGDRIVLEFTVHQQADPQTVPTLSTPPVEARLLSFQSDGRGRTVLGLQELFPLEGTMELVNDSVRLNPAPEGLRRLTSHIEISHELREPGPESEAAQQPAPSHVPPF